MIYLKRGSGDLPIASKHGIYRRKYHLRAVVQSGALLLLVAGYAAYSFVQSPTDRNSITPGSFTTSPFHHHGLEGSMAVDEGKERTGGFFNDVVYPAGGRRLDAPLCDDIERADPAWLLVFYVLGVIYMFLALAIACDEFFVPALEEMSSERHLNLSTDVAGATLMAAGGSAPELFTSLFGTFQRSSIGFGTIVGSAVFNVLFVIAMCAMLAREVLTLTWWPLFRDSLYYAIGLAVLSVFIGVTTRGEITLWEACVLFGMYIVYIIIMFFNREIYKLLTGKTLQDPEDMEEEAPKEGDGAVENGRQERPKQSSARSMKSGNDSFVFSGDGTISRPANFRWQGTFRAGILKLLRDPDSWLDTAGVGIVAKLAGDVDYVFRQVDINGDGNIDRDELEQLFELLECHLSPHELDDVFKQLDQDKDGAISEAEFSGWYVRSEERILSQVKHVFDSFDVNSSNTIDRTELKMLLEKLEPRVTETDIDDAIDQMYKSGSRDEITFDEFSEWYRKSLIYERHRKAVEEDMEGVWENLKPPLGGGFMDWLKYLLVLPLVAVLTLTIPDVQRPGYGKWCYISFILSIIWIGAFAYLMVNWAEVIGNTLGIPSVIMGLTILAAGTSVPDLLSSVIVARRGNGDMAVSSSIGSNVFDILVGLPVPWILFTAWPSTEDRVNIGSDNFDIFTYILLAMLIFVIVAVHCQGWRLTKALGFMMFIYYFAFLAGAIVLELPFETCMDGVPTAAPTIATP